MNGPKSGSEQTFDATYLKSATSEPSLISCAKILFWPFPRINSDFLGLKPGSSEKRNGIFGIRPVCPLWHHKESIQLQ